jgi:hypothetical protein
LLVLAWYGYGKVFLAGATACFASDVLDGYLARRLEQRSALGAQLDSVSDFVLYITSPRDMTPGERRRYEKSKSSISQARSYTEIGKIRDK